jgi:hypothetical protein
MFSMTLAGTSPFMYIIYKFCLLMVSQGPFIFFSYILGFFYLHLNVLTHVPCFKPQYSVFNLIQSMGDILTAFYFTYWTFHIQNFNLIFFRIARSLLSQSILPNIFLFISFSSLFGDSVRHFSCPL